MSQGRASGAATDERTGPYIPPGADQVDVVIEIATWFYLHDWSQIQIARALGLDPSTVSRHLKRAREEAIVRGGQIFLTNCTACHNFTGEGGAMPRGGYAPKLLDTDPKYIYEAMLTGPQSMDTFSNGNITPQEKKDVIAYIESMRKQPGYGGFGLGGLGPVSEGLFAWVGGLGVMVAFAVWIAAHTTRTKKKKGTAE